MNVLIVIVAGVSAGWVAQKLYHVCFTTEKCNDAEDVDKQVAKESKKLAKKDPPADGGTIASKKEAGKQVKKTKKEPNKEESTQFNDDHVDDLSQLKGVGPKLFEALAEIGVHNYEQLYEPSMELLLTRLRETGGRFTRPALTAIVERAKLAAKERA